ncbi:ladderlectin-like [Coregonus clupeaformis]|uniref:ladderlectin-like n=1 Tax=Coregonus clupeaformis TaxID=59861 RepID=UPI001E1C7618|nr:ladderlectin-like [Coregonus clupeaformis]
MPFREAEEVETQSRSCPSGWTRYGSRCFMFVSTQRTWLEAERYCVHFGANLASVHSSAEHHFVQELVRRHTNDLTYAWIGGFDHVQNRVWLWSDGSRLDYTSWHTGEPNNYNGKREPCLMMNWGGEKRWNDGNCGDKYSSVCVKRIC